MKRHIILLIFLAFVIISCKKNQSLKKKSIQNIVFQGKYLGEGCWSVIQVIKPSPSTIDLAQSGTQWIGPLSSNEDTLYYNAVGAGVIPEAYKNGNIFYFTISRIDSNLIHVDYCDAPKYYLSIRTISFNKPVDNAK